MFLRLGIVFLILAIIAGIFGFKRVASFSSFMAKLLFFVAIAGFVLSIVVWILF